MLTFLMNTPLRTPLTLGDIVAITFLDHCEDDDAMTFTVYGRVSKLTRPAIEVTCWAYADGRVSSDDTNEKKFSIVRKAITQIQKLTPKR